jgi:site-specific DNA-methyltransferase (adenine-specific)
MPLPAGCAGLAFTSPPYNAGKEFDADLSLPDYMDLITRVGREVYRVLAPGGRYVINIANLGRKPYIPLHAYFYQAHMQMGFLPMGEIIWQKAKGAGSNCAWGSWRSARSPRLRDLHEYLLVFAKGEFSRPDRGESSISAEEFMQATLSVWNIPPVSARKIGHPAPFPLELASRVIRLYSYTGDLVIDPFCGSGTTCAAAKMLGRHYAGFDVSSEYCALAEERVKAVEAPAGIIDSTI